MDKEKHITDDELAKMLEDGFQFDDITGQQMQFKIDGIIGDGGKWTVGADASTSLTVNGVDWAIEEIKIKAIDGNFDDALATIMLSLIGQMNDPKFLASLRKQLDTTKVLGRSDEVQ